MGYGAYSLEAHQAITRQHASKDAAEVFTQGSCHPDMNPMGVRLRECRDSEAHPESLGVIFALDVSGSMGDIPVKLATETLPGFMECVLAVTPHPQVMFMAFGNEFTDRSPLQVGQFESEASLMDRWLRDIHLEGAGGGLGESYGLAMYFASRHTSMDCFEKRGKKGYLFMTGDEVTFSQLPPDSVRKILGGQIDAAIPIRDIVVEAQEKFHIFFLIPDANRAAQYETGAVWEMFLHERSVVLEGHRDTAYVCAVLLGIEEGHLRDVHDITRLLEQMGRTASERERILRVVSRFLDARTKGEIAAPGHPGVRKNSPNIGG